MVRSLKFIEVTAKAIGIKDGEVKSQDLKPYVYTGRKLSKAALEKIFKEQIKDSDLKDILIVEEKEVIKKYRVDLAKFLEIAEEVHEDEEEEEQTEQLTEETK